MSSFRNQLIKLAYENPDLREDLLPLIKAARANPQEQDQGNETKAGPSTRPGGQFVQFMKEMGDEKVKNPDTGNIVKLKSLKGDKGKKIQQDEFKKWLKSQDGKGKKEDSTGKSVSFSESNVVPLFPSQSGGGGGKDEAPAKAVAPKFERQTVREKTKSKKRQTAEDELKSNIAEKYKDKVDENGEYPPEIMDKMNQEYSKGMDDLDKADLEEQKKKDQKEKDSFLQGKTNADKQRREDHSNAVLEELKAEHGDDKETIGELHTKAMNKYDDKIKKEKQRKDDGLLKTFQQSKDKWKGLTKKYLDPENLRNIVASRHASRRVAERHTVKSEATMKPNNQRVANRHLEKTAGGSDFQEYVNGSDARRCFAEAVQNAKYDYGSGGYTGTIAEKDSFKIVSRTPMTEHQATEYMEANISRNDKWGPAFAIPIAEERELSRQQYTVQVKARSEYEARQVAKELIKSKGRTRKGAAITVEILFRGGITLIKEAGKPKMGWVPDANKFWKISSYGNLRSANNLAYGSKRDAVAAAKEQLGKATDAEVGAAMTVFEVKKLGAVEVTAQATRLAVYEVTGTRVQSAVGSKVKGWYFFGIASS